MDDSLDFLKDGATPRTLLHRFMAVADVRQTPIPFRTRGAAAKHASIQETQSGTKKRRSTRLNKGDQSMSREVVRQQAKQSASFIDHTLNASVIQGANQTYANIVAQESDSSSSLITSFDMEKAAKWQKRKKKKLEDASIPAEVVPKPPAKKKSKKKGLPSTNTSTTSVSEKGKSGEKAADTKNIKAQKIQPDEPQTQSTQSSTEANTAGNESQVSLPSIASPVAGEEKVISDVSADGSYSFISEKDDSHLNIGKTKDRFGTQVKSRKLNLPSIIELLPAKQKSIDPETVASAEDALDAPDLQGPSAESPAASPNISQELNKKTSQDTSNNFILPPLSFRDDETITTDILRETNFSTHDIGNRYSETFIHQEEPEASQGLLNVQEEDVPVDLEGTPAGHLKPVSKIITPTPTPMTTPSASAQRKSVGEVTATTTPTVSAQRKSVGEVTATTTPTRSSQRKSVGEVTATTTPTRPMSLRKNVTSILVSPQADKAVKDISTTGSVRETRASEASQAWQQVSTAVASLPSDDGTSEASSHSQEEVESHDTEEIGESARGVSGDEEDEFESENPSKKRRISGSSSKDAAQDVLPEEAIEEAPVSDSEDGYDLNLEPLQLSFHGDDGNATTASHIDALKVTTASTTPTPKAQPSTPKAQPSAPLTTAKVRQMTMKEFLEQLKTKPLPPPVHKPKPLLANLLGASSPSKTLAKPPQQQKRKRGRKTSALPATLSRSVTKELFTHFAKCRVTAAAVNEVVKYSEIFWSNLTKDIFSLVSETADQIEARDVEKVMKRVKIITPEQTLNSLAEELLPMEMWSMFMPFPDAAKNPFSNPIIGELPNLYQPDDLEEDEIAG